MSKIVLCVNANEKCVQEMRIPQHFSRQIPFIKKGNKKKEKHMNVKVSYFRGVNSPMMYYFGPVSLE